MAGPRPLRSTDPRRIGGYELLGLLGAGGQGTVYLARSGTGQEVAVKLLRTEVVDDPRARRFLERELTSMRRVAPFCTAQILAFHADGDAPHLVSEYIAGPNLQDHVAETGPLTGAALTTLAIATATALTAVHEAGVVHRDFKPANVLLGPDGPRVIDFGIARPLDATSATVSQAVGTPAYMAPEQLAGDPAGPPMDLFAWGCAMVFAASGQTAFPGPTAPVVINKIMNGEPDLGALTGPLRELVAGCLAKDPAVRPSAPQVLLRLLGGNVQGGLLSEGASAAATLVPGTGTAPGGTALSAPSGTAGSAPGGTWIATQGIPAQPNAPAPHYPMPPDYPMAPVTPWPAVPPPTMPSAGLPPRPPSGDRVRRRLIIGVAVVLATVTPAAVLLADHYRDAPSAGSGGPESAAGSGAATAPASPGTDTVCSYRPTTGGDQGKATGTPPARPVSGPAERTISTNLGNITVRLDPAKAPCTVNSFHYLAKSGYYTNSSCHRLSTNSALRVVQCGDPTGTGTGTPSYLFANENGAKSFARGTVAMANSSDIASNGSQFFIVYGDIKELASDYSVFGTVVGGLDLVDKVAAAGTTDGTTDGSPKQKLTINSITE